MTAKNAFHAGFVLVALALCANAAAQTPEADFTREGPDDLFAAGQYEATLTSGVLFSPFIATYHRPTINYSVTSIQLGYMLSNLRGNHLLRGNLEVIGELFGDAIFTGAGNYISGVTVWGRYNFVQPGWRVVPFFQVGLGLTATDLDRRIVGQVFNFNIEVGVGARYLLSSRWGIDLEYRYQHISNADTGPHNLGINAHGPILGLSYFF
jgi:lipid A 3-O-deacylase